MEMYLLVMYGGALHIKHYLTVVEIITLLVLKLALTMVLTYI